jgi:hypothetical protein
VKFAKRLLCAQFKLLTDALGEAAVFRLLAGNLPPCCEDDDPPGPVLVEIELGPQAFENADGKLALAETLIGKGTASAGRGKLARCYRLYAADGECITQGSVGALDDDCDLLLDNVSIAAGQKFVVGNFELKMRE